MSRSLGTMIYFLVVLFCVVRSEESGGDSTATEEPGVKCPASYLNSGFLLASPLCFPCQNQCQFYLQPGSDNVGHVSMTPVNSSSLYFGSFIQPWGMFGMYQIFPLFGNLLENGDKLKNMTQEGMKKEGCKLLKNLLDAICADCNSSSNIDDNLIKIREPEIPETFKNDIEIVYKLIIDNFNDTEEDISKLVFENQSYKNLLENKGTDYLMRYVLWKYRVESQVEEWAKQYQWTKYKAVMIRMENSIQEYTSKTVDYGVRQERL